MVATKPVTKESTKEAVKPLRGEGRSVSAEPVCSCAHFLVHIAHETAGAARTRSALRPLWGEGGKCHEQPGRISPRDREGVCATTTQLSSPAKAGDPVFQRRQ